MVVIEIRFAGSSEYTAQLRAIIAAQVPAAAIF